MGRTKGVKNRPKSESILHYVGHFLLDSGTKIKFDITEEDVDDLFQRMLNNVEFNPESELIWLGENADTSFLLAKKIVGFSVDSCEKSD